MQELSATPEGRALWGQYFAMNRSKRIFENAPSISAFHDLNSMLLHPSQDSHYLVGKLYSFDDQTAGLFEQAGNDAHQLVNTLQHDTTAYATFCTILLYIASTLERWAGIHFTVTWNDTEGTELKLCDLIQDFSDNVASLQKGNIAQSEANELPYDLRLFHGAEQTIIQQRKEMLSYQIGKNAAADAFLDFWNRHAEDLPVSADTATPS